MSGIGVIGAGAFGTALAVALAPPAGAGGLVTLFARDAGQVEAMRRERENARRLPGIPLPEGLQITADPAALAGCDVLLLAVPMQRTAAFVAANRALLEGRALVACAKGIDLTTGHGPAATLAELLPGQVPALLTGPSFAADIGRGLPTALTLACTDAELGARLQARLATPVLRLYRSTDVTGAELGGALKNVVAIAAGIVIGAGLGDSARAALMTRGLAEIVRLAVARGARPETLQGLAGFGDLVLTCTSDKSRNFRHGLALGRGTPPDAGATVEGAATARAVAALAAREGLAMPVAQMVAAILDDRATVGQATEALLARPLKEE